MCTRYAIEKDLPKEFRLIVDEAVRSPLTSRFIDTHGRPLVTEGEVRPTDIVPVIAPNAHGSRSVYPMQWGFTGRDNKRNLFNARVETAGSKQTFQDAWRSHRCIIPASYYFEWEHLQRPDGKTETGRKYLIQPAGQTMTWLCGLYRIEDGYPVFVVLTKEATKDLRRIHDRMPLMLPEGMIDEWILPSSDPATLISHALTDMIPEAVP